MECMDKRFELSKKSCYPLHTKDFVDCILSKNFVRATLTILEKLDVAVRQTLNRFEEEFVA